MYQLAFGKRFAPLLAAAFIAAFLSSCDGAAPNIQRQSSAKALETHEQIAARLRALHFAQDEQAASREGEKLFGKFQASPKAVAWHVLNLSKVGQLERAAALSNGLLESSPNDSWTKFAIAAALLLRYDRSADELLGAARSALIASPNNPDFIWLHAEALRLRDRNKELLVFIDQYGSLVNSTPELLNVKGLALSNEALADRTDNAKVSAALDIFAQVRELDLTNVNAHLLPGRFLLRLQRPSEAYPLLREAARLSTAIRVQKEHWISIVNRQDLSKSDQRTLIDESIRRSLRSRSDDLDFLWVASAAYEELDMPARQIELEDRVLASDSESPVAEEIMMARINRIARTQGEDSHQVRERLRKFLGRERHHNSRLLNQAQRRLFYSLKSDSGADPRELLDLVQGMSRGTAVARTLAYSEGIIALASHKQLLGDAEKLATTGLAMLSAASTADRNSEVELRPGENVPLTMESALRDALGLVYFNQGRDKDAELEWLSVYRTESDRPSVLLHLAQLYEKRGDFERAEGFYIKCTALPQMEKDSCSTALRTYYLKRQGPNGSFEDYLAGVRDRLDRERTQRILATQLSRSEATPPVTLKSLDGNMLTLSDLKGKIAVIKFWGLWCEPCQEEMPAFVRFADRYSKEKDVVIVTVNYDPDPITVRQWMQKNKYNFTVLLDNGSRLREQISGIPTAWFVDSNAKKVFEVAGAIGNLDEEYSKRIELIRAMTVKPD